MFLWQTYFFHFQWKIDKQSEGQMRIDYII